MYKRNKYLSDFGFSTYVSSYRILQHLPVRREDHQCGCFPLLQETFSVLDEMIRHTDVVEGLIQLGHFELDYSKHKIIKLD